MQAGICWQWEKKSASNVGLMSRPGKKKGGELADWIHQCKLWLHTLSVHQPEKAWSSPPQVSIKVCRWNEHKCGRRPALLICFSVIWCEKKRRHVLCSLSVSGASLLRFSHIVLWDRQMFLKLSTLKTPVKISFRYRNLQSNSAHWKRFLSGTVDRKITVSWMELLIRINSLLIVRAPRVDFENV